MRCDDDSLTKPNANHVCGRLVDVSPLDGRSHHNIDRTKCWKLPIKRTASRKMEYHLPIVEDADEIHTARVHVFSDSVLFMGIED